MKPPTPIPIPSFATTHLHHLKTEHSLEIASSTLSAASVAASPATRRALQATGHALTGLVLSQTRTGLGGRLVGEFVPDAATSSSTKSDNKNGATQGKEDGRLRLPAHGIRVGDVVRCLEISNSSSKKSSGAGGKKDGEGGKSKAPEGVVTRVGEGAVWVAFGQQGAAGASGKKEEEEGVEELWGKRVWLYVVCPASLLSSALRGGLRMIRN
ncbi:uncharacterized protein BP01DRAFT_172256 [Aspergillus saccharolyticus JOP 1030-1]|uniref:Uncharacterized protein n=1 Tax=Aspergillus saccharolyticus JOP 1030-1 TaxID=1450539 RepID=A0A318Z2R0_9EURO|nr:hypothetical protein BP01DRAFT_172256 [Aspergillus saccharolyticus JOP 1030-1]PYH41279.1 hypothetical protein BP01DRAFT_172256 [Aspergillus saccharolyticus JOP 1030-1]